jgi:hypothetical protein
MALSREHLIQAGFLAASAGATWWIYNRSRAGLTSGAAAGTPVVQLPSPQLPVQTISPQPAGTSVGDLATVGSVNLGPPSSVVPSMVYNVAGSSVGGAGAITNLFGGAPPLPTASCGCCTSPPAQGSVFFTLQDAVNQLPPMAAPTFTPPTSIVPAAIDSDAVLGTWAGPEVTNYGEFPTRAGFSSYGA